MTFAQRRPAVTPDGCTLSACWDEYVESREGLVRPDTVTRGTLERLSPKKVSVPMIRTSSGEGWARRDVQKRENGPPCPTPIPPSFALRRTQADRRGNMNELRSIVETWSTSKVSVRKVKGRERER